MDAAPLVKNAQHAFGTLLKQYRLAAGLSQEALAERARISPGAVRAYEQGQRHAPYRETVTLLVAALGLSAQQAAALEATIPRRRGPLAFPTASSLTNLPLPVTSFIGREHEVAEVISTMAHTRLLTLTGTGGTGKTRLALEVAGLVADRFPQGVWLVELAPLAEPSGVAAAVAAALDVREEAGQPLLSTLVAALYPRRLLLVLDNCEHLLEAGAALVSALLRGCPQLTTLATSREVLGIAGETVRRVPSLALPEDEHVPAENLVHVDSVRLLVERAQAVDAAFALTAQNAAAVARVCRRLDGIPLALELAAARLRGLSVDELAARLDRRFQLLTGGSRTALPRQQTLQATVEWSYGLLDEAEQALFNRLAVFPGSFTLEAAEIVCAGAPVDSVQVIDLVLRLVDKSLLLVEGESAGLTRYRLLETLRHYGRERLAAVGEAEMLYSRHFAYYREMAARSEKLPHELLVETYFDSIAAEHENLRQALDWAVDRGAGQEGLRLAGGLGTYWWYRGRIGEGLRRLRTLLALPDAATRTAERALGLFYQALLSLGAARLAARPWRGAERRALYEEALSIAREVGDRDVEAWSLVFLGQTIGDDDYVAACASLEEGLSLADTHHWYRLSHLALVGLGVVAWLHGDRTMARRRHEQSLQRSRQHGDRDGYARALEFLAAVRFQEGEVDEALRNLLECLDEFRAMRDHMGTALVLGMLGVVVAVQGDAERARAYFQEKRALWEQVGERSGTASALRDMGWLALREGAIAQARAWYGEALALERALGNTAGSAAALAGLGTVDRAEGEPARAVARYVEALALCAGGDAVQECVACLEGLAAIALAAGDAPRAARLCGAIARHRLREVPISPAVVDVAAALVAQVRTALGDEQFEALWTEGQALSLEDAIGLAVAVRASG